MTPKAIRTCILEKTAQRGQRKTICPSEVARALDSDNWRELMPAVREQGRQLAAKGKIWVMQKGQRVDPHEAKGPIRYQIVDLSS